MACCATTGCDDPVCYLCTVIAKLPQPAKYTTPDAQKRDRAELRDSTPLEMWTDEHTPAVSLAYRKRKREGAVRQQR
jgi:hypothetical protein